MGPLLLVGITTLEVTLAILMMGCRAEPPPVSIYEDKRDGIQLMFDPESGNGHSHPYQISREELARAMTGVYVQQRDIVSGIGIFGDDEGEPAFTAMQIAFASPYLVEALRKASPKDIATFYLSSWDKQMGKVVTSGGIFVRDDRMFVMLANAHTSPNAVQYENTYSFDPRETPLIPIARKKFVVRFTPKEAWIPNKEFRGKRDYEPYLDESKLVIIDLKKLAVIPSSPPVQSDAKPPVSGGQR